MKILVLNAGPSSQKSCLRSHIGAMLASLGGLDVLVFTAGGGEHSAVVRAAACEAADSTVRVLVIRAEEDWAMAGECWKLVHESRKEKPENGGLLPTEVALNG